MNWCDFNSDELQYDSLIVTRSASDESDDWRKYLIVDRLRSGEFGNAKNAVTHELGMHGGVIAGENGVSGYEINFGNTTVERFSKAEH